MAGEQQDSIWPLPKFYFTVTIGPFEIRAQEVSGLDIEAQVIEYRAGDSKAFSTIKMPGLKKFGNVTLKKVVFSGGDRFWDWFGQIKMNTIKRTDVVVRLLDESGAPTMVWTLKNAFPTKITGTDLKSEGNEVAIETIELAHEGLEISG